MSLFNREDDLEDDDEDDVDEHEHGHLDLHVTPTTVKSGDPVVTLDSFPTLRAFPRRVSLHLPSHNCSGWRLYGRGFLSSVKLCDSSSSTVRLCRQSVLCYVGIGAQI